MAGLNSIMLTQANTNKHRVRDIDEKLLSQLRGDSVDESILEEELNNISADDLDFSGSTATVRKRLGHILHSTPVEIVLVILVIIDVIILLSLLLIDLNVLNLKLQDTKEGARLLHKVLKTTCDNPRVSSYNGTNLNKIAEYLTEGGCSPNAQNKVNNTDDSRIHKRTKRGAGGGDSSNPTVILLVEIGHVLHICSIVILAIMVIEVFLKIFALGVKYFKGKLEVVDGVVIFISFALDIYFTDGIGPTNTANATSALVILLMWRIIRVFNAILVTAKKRLQFRIRVQKRMRKVLDDKVTDLEEEAKTLQMHVDNLERMAKMKDIQDYEIKACKPLTRAMKKANTQAGIASMMQMSMGLLKGMNNISSHETEGHRKSNGLSEMLHRRPSVSESKVEKETVKEVLADAMSMNSETRLNLTDSIHGSGSITTDTQFSQTVGFIQSLATGVKYEPPQSNKTSVSSMLPGVEFTKAFALSAAKEDDDGIRSLSGSLPILSCGSVNSIIPTHSYQQTRSQSLTSKNSKGSTGDSLKSIGEEDIRPTERIMPKENEQ